VGPYLVIVRVGLDNNESSGVADEGVCGISTHTFGRPTLGDDFVNAYSLPGAAATSYSFSGVLVVSSNDEPVTPSFACNTSLPGGTDPTVSNVQWWVSPIGS
jgi:hypothetical protein